MEPITVTLCDQKAILGGKSQRDIGKTVCTYEYMRQRDNMNKWEPYRLQPQWIKLMGGSYGGKMVGQVLIAFELLQWKYRDDPELQCKEMWPVDEEEYMPFKHFSRSRKATLHFALYGLRDLVPASLSSDSMQPLVIVQVKQYNRRAHESTDPEEHYYTLTFEYKDLIENGEKESKWDKLHKWRSDAFGRKDCWNFELFQVGKMAIMLPDTALLQPFVKVKVVEKPWALMKVFGQEGTLVGEHRQSLNELYPCCWYPGVDKNKPFEQQRPLIWKQIRLAKEASQAHDKFVEESKAERATEMRLDRQRRFEEQRKNFPNRIEPEAEKADEVSSSALPLEMRPKDSTNDKGYTKREQLTLKPEHKLNMRKVKSFPPRMGEKIRRKDEDVNHRVVPGKLEDSTEEHLFQPDFLFRNRPLLRNHDTLEQEEATVDWNHQYADCFGFLKYAIKLTDGWEEDAEMDDEMDDESYRHSSPEVAEKYVFDGSEADLQKLSRSYGLKEDLNKHIFDVSKFQRKYKSKDNVPSRVRVRIYLVQAICIFGKGRSFPDPYLAFTLGKNISVSMRNMVKHDTNTPTFYRVEERDIDMPIDARLQVDLYDYSDIVISEKLIGSTVMDLEDRWHSDNWKLADERRRIPRENRPLFNPAHVGHNCGSLEMWIEMIDTVKASDRKATELHPPRPIMIEVRMIIWTTTNVKLVDGNHTDVKVGVQLECNEYGGESIGFPKQQFTDTHAGCKDGEAKFNWRIVFPRIVMPTRSCTLDISVYDENFVGGDTFIGSVSIDLRRYVEKVARDLDMIKTEADLRIHATAGGSETRKGEEEENVGQVQFELQIMTKSEAMQKTAGKGREEPNQYPQLLTPTEGRGWADVFVGIGFELPDINLWKKVIPLILFTLLCLVLLKWIRLL